MALFSLVPTLTSNTAPFGTVSASSVYSVAPTTAFNGLTSGYNGWLNNAVALPQWLQYQFPQPKIATAYSIAPWDADNFPTRCPNAWQFQGSNDGTTWDTLDTQSGINTWVLSTTKIFTFTNTTAYTYYRLYITANGGNAYTGLRLLSILGEEARADLLLHMDGTNGGTTFTDSSDRALTPTVSATTTTTTDSKFGVSSGNFVGASASRIYFPSTITTPLIFGTGNFSIDFWIKPGATQTYPTTWRVIGTCPGTWTANSFVVGSNSGTAVGFYVYNNSSTVPLLNYTSTLAASTWAHIAISRVGNDFAMYVNGSLVSQAVWAGSMDGGVSQTLTIGNSGNLGNEYVNALIDEFRITAGNSAYSQLPGSPATTANLLLHMDGANAGTTFTDSGTGASTITPTATTTSTAIVPKFGTASALFNGTTSFLTVGSGAVNPMNLNGVASASIDFWVYRASGTNYGSIMADGAGGTTSLLDITFESLVNGKISVRCRNGSSTDTRLDSNYVIPATTWTHVAVVWTSTTQVYLFINGAIDASGTLPAVPAFTTSPMVMGKNPFGGGFFSGYIDEVRILRGSSAFTVGFTPNTVQYGYIAGNATGQSNQSAGALVSISIGMSVSTGQANQSVAASLMESINGLTGTTQVYTTDAVGGLRIAMVSGSTGQSMESIGGSLLMFYDLQGGTSQTKQSLNGTASTYIGGSSSTGQSIESSSFIGVVANPISAATSTGQSSQELNATVARLISGSMSTGQSNQHVEAAMVMAFFAPSNINTRIKTTSTMPRRVVKAIQDKKHNMGRNG